MSSKILQVKPMAPHTMPAPLSGHAVVLLIFIWLSLYAAGLHFFDNVVFFNEYPEPAWLTPFRVAALFVPIALYAHMATHRIYLGQLSRALRLAHPFVFAHTVSLGHYLFAPPTDIPARINALIALQVGLALALLLVVIVIQRRHFPTSLWASLRLWGKMVAAFVLVVFVLEYIWPSKFNLWWLG